MPTQSEPLSGNKPKVAHDGLSYPPTEPLSADWRVPKGVRLSVKPLKGMSSNEVDVLDEEDVQADGNGGALNHTGTKISEPDISQAEMLSLCKQASKYIMKHHNNLDLSDYNQYLGEFQKYSSNMFDFGDSSVFKVAEKSNEEKLNEKLKRSTNNEYEKTERQMK